MPPRNHVLLAPVTVTPTKPLTPSHLKGLLWTDVMFRATAPLAEVTYRYSPTTYHVTEQTVGFWEYLDRTRGETDYAQFSEEEIGELYVRYRSEEQPPSAKALRPYRDAIEHSGWTHPASRRLLELWTGHYKRLGMHDPGLKEHQPPGLALEQMVEQLAATGLVLDQRDCGGPVYLDLTRYGMPRAASSRRTAGPTTSPAPCASCFRSWPGTTRSSCSTTMSWTPTTSFSAAS
ncbi:hypothetical protein REH65_32475 [Saccharopolyspora sp. ID03-671]|uniref:hypothetical protein n=1 Tax=Saccharopolyspora sp. ID03-671 TaxID=3073066 RepID=UPI003252BD8D